VLGKVRAQQVVRESGHTSGALTHREVGLMAQKLGFELVYVNDLPHSARSVTDLDEQPASALDRRASIPGGHGLRSMALQAIAHRLLGHEVPTSYAEFLRQRLEINYFAAACLMPREQSVAFLSQAKADRNIAVEDFRDAFGVTHEAAALRGQVEQALTGRRAWPACHHRTATHRCGGAFRRPRDDVKDAVK